MKKVLFISSTSRLGGAQISLLSIVYKLHNKQINGLVISNDNGPLVEKLDQNYIKCKVMSLYAFRKRHLFLFIFSIIRLTLYIKKHSIDIIHANDIHAILMTVWAAKLSKVPIIGHIRDATPLSPNMQKRLKRADILIAISNTVFELFKDKKNIEMIYNGIDTNRFRPVIDNSELKKKYDIKNNKIVISWIHRISPEKGLEDFIKAAKLLLEKHKDIVFYVVGDIIGEYALEYKKKQLELAAKLGIDAHFHFTGFVDNPFTYFQLSDICVFTNPVEAFGKVCAEAMSCGIPIITPDEGGMAEINKENETGLYYKSGDEKDLADQIFCLINDLQERKKMGEKGRNRVIEKFNLDKMANKLSSLYNDMV